MKQSALLLQLSAVQKWPLMCLHYSQSLLFSPVTLSQVWVSFSEDPSWLQELFQWPLISGTFFFFFFSLGPFHSSFCPEIETFQFNLNQSYRCEMTLSQMERCRSNKTVRSHSHVSSRRRRYPLAFLPRRPGFAFCVNPNVTDLFLTLTKSCLQLFLNQTK